MMDEQNLPADRLRPGAVFDETTGDPETGHRRPLHYGDPRAEYQAARTGAALFDLAGQTQLELAGRDRAKFLHNFCTNDIRGLPADRGCEAFVTSVQGKVLAHISVFAGAEALAVESVPGAAERIIPHLSRYQISEDVEFRDRTADLGTLFLSGPEAAAVVQRAGIDATALAPMQQTTAAIAGGDLHVRRTDRLGFPGFTLVTPKSCLETLWSQLVQHGARPAGSMAFEPLRIEAGTPLYGPDITDANLAQEVHRTAACISFTKGCYLGQEPIARIDALGHVNQELFGIDLAPGETPPPGSEIFAAGMADKPIGRITSSALSYLKDAPVALGYLRRPSNTKGTQVQIRWGERQLPGVVFWP